MSNILEEIVQHKRKEVATSKELTPIKKLEQSKYFDTTCVSFSSYIKKEDKIGLVAEFKRRSPSKKQINIYADPKEVSIGYMQAGASAISVLTDQLYFGGSSSDLITARDYNLCPILRKDFIIDEYQIIEAKSIGADAILLIAEVLSNEEVKSLSSTAHQLGLEVLLEMHSGDHVEKITDHIDVVGINNRDLTTFVTDIKHSVDVYDQLPADIVKISESGIHSPEQAAILHRAGFDGYLIGELFMKHHSPNQACQQFIRELKKLIK